MPATKRHARTGPASSKRSRTGERAPAAPTGRLLYGGTSRYTTIATRRKEIKAYGTVPFVAQSLTTAGNVLQAVCNDIPQGDGYQEREGRVVRLLDLSGTVFISLLSASQNVNLRILVFTWKQTGVNPPNITDILDASNVNSEYSVALSQNFKILYDRIHYVAQNFAAHNVTKYFPIQAKIPMDQVYESGSSGPCNTNGLYILAVWDVPSPGSGFITSKFKTRFVDI